jgi:hypothetical protein
MLAFSQRFQQSIGHRVSYLYFFFLNSAGIVKSVQDPPHTHTKHTERRRQLAF